MRNLFKRDSKSLFFVKGWELFIKISYLNFKISQNCRHLADIIHHHNIYIPYDAYIYLVLLKPNSHFLLIDDAGALMTLNCICGNTRKKREVPSGHKKSNANETKLNDL